jgi:ribosomal protein S18 acetylase RimI-like enzyme
MEDKIYFFNDKHESIRDLIENYSINTCRGEMNRVYLYRCWRLFDFGYIITNPKYILGTDYRNYELIAFIFCVNFDKENRIHVLLACVDEKYKKQCNVLFLRLKEDCKNMDSENITLDVSQTNHKLIFYYENFGFYQLYNPALSSCRFACERQHLVLFICN